MKVLVEGMFRDMDNAKLLMLICGGCLFLANIGIILFLLFLDGHSTAGILNFLEQEITLLIPTSGLVSIIQHAVGQFFGARKPSAPPAA